MNRARLWQCGLLILFLVAASFPLPAIAGGDWNDGGIEWRSHGEGLAEAKQDGKPICLIVYTETCPHCTNYSRVFHDAEIEQLSKQFVMIRLDQDRHRSLAMKYGPDGKYIPRTMFLSAAGEIEPEIKVNREEYLYFYDEHDPTQLRAAMKSAHGKLQSGD